MKKTMLAMLGVVALTASCSGCNKKETPPPPAVPEKTATAPVPDEKPAPPPPPKPSPQMTATQEADSALQHGDVNGAITQAQAAVKSEPANALSLNTLGRAAMTRFFQNKNPKDAAMAREAFTKATTANPTFWPAYQNLGELEERQGNLKAAAAAYKKVLEAQPNHPEKARYEQVMDKAAGKKPPAAPKKPAAPPATKPAQ